MPELPEVETIRIGLEKKVVRLIIKNIQVLNSKSFLGDSLQIVDSKVITVWRRAKVLGINLLSFWKATCLPAGRTTLPESGIKTKTDSGPARMTLLIHLKMSGQLIFISNDKQLTINHKRFAGGHPTKDMTGEMPNRSTRVIFEFSDGSKLFFNDQRKFGWIKLVDSEQLKVQSFLNKLGPEPLEKEFSWQILKERLLRHKSQAIKVALLDQTVVSGIGNIYACEACFNAKIDPRTKVSSLTDDQYQKLTQGIIKALTDSLKYGGSSKTHFVSEEGKKGLFLEFAFLYGREGEKCKVCLTVIEKIKLGGRGTYFCPNCQK